VFPLEQTPTFEIGGNRVEGVGDGEDLPPTPDPTPLDPPDEEAALGGEIARERREGRDEDPKEGEDSEDWLGERTTLANEAEEVVPAVAEEVEGDATDEDPETDEEVEYEENDGRADGWNPAESLEGEEGIGEEVAPPELS